MDTEGHGAPCPSRSGFGIQRTAEAPEAPQTPFTHPVPRGVGVPGQKKTKNLHPLRATSVPYFIQIRPAVWISIVNKHPNKHTHQHCPLYIRRRLAWVTQHCPDDSNEVLKLVLRLKVRFYNSSMLT